MYIGSGDISALMSGLNTKSHHNLFMRFVSGVKPEYNAKNSPIDAFRTGAILEDRYLLTLPDNYYSQYLVFSDEMDVFKATLDFAKIENGKVSDFEELKSISFSDFIEFMPYKNNNNDLIKYVQKKYKNYYNQVQQQLYCTGLESAYLVFLSVMSYDDEENYNRVIKPEDYIKIRIYRDNITIQNIKERGRIFQIIKDIYR